MVRHASAPTARGSERMLRSVRAVARRYGDETLTTQRVARCAERAARGVVWVRHSVAQYIRAPRANAHAG